MSRRLSIERGACHDDSWEIPDREERQRGREAEKEKRDPLANRRNEEATDEVTYRPPVATRAYLHTATLPNWGTSILSRTKQTVSSRWATSTLSHSATVSSRTGPPVSSRTLGLGFRV